MSLVCVSGSGGEGLGVVCEEGEGVSRGKEALVEEGSCKANEGYENT